MSKIITNARTIKADHWQQEYDGKWYVHIPFAAQGKDVLIEFVDSDEYIQEHKDDFDSLNSGTTSDTECVITADHKPSCDMLIELKYAEDENGEIIYRKVGDQFIPEWKPNDQGGFGGFDALAGLMGGMGMNADPNQIIDTAGKLIKLDEEKKEEPKKE